MSKAFADVAESDSFKFAVLWKDKPSFEIVRILMTELDEDIDSLCARNGASERHSVGESGKSLETIASILHGSAGDELEPLLSNCNFNNFSLNALRILRKSVPRGRVVSYGQLAKLCGSPGASRAIGAAMGANPFPIFYPCHRVVGSNGSLTGFGFGLQMKRRLLEMEGIEFKKNSIDMKLFSI